MIVYLSSFKSLSSLKRYGEIKYVSHRMHYVVIFVNQRRIHKILNKLSRLRSVEEVFKSPIFNLSRTLINKTINELSKEDRES